MGSDVYLVRGSSDEGDKAVQEKVRLAFDKAGLSGCIQENDLVAVKLHIGERGQKTFVPPAYVKPVVDAVKDAGGQPFLTDTNTLYRGQRENAVKHLNLAREHGFTPEAVGAPMMIADGPSGASEVEVPVAGKHYEAVGIAEGIVSANALIAITHPTGHPGTGLGGVIKNLGMGCSSKKGKLAQHSKTRPKIDAGTCTACGRCVKMCPVDCISWKKEKAWIDPDNCIGCGECLAMCRFGAVRFAWDQASEDLQTRIVEHVMGVVKGKEGKIGYVCVLMFMTEGCDCYGQAMDPIVPDVGIIAGTDPIAMDTATLDLTKEAAGKSLPEVATPGVDFMVEIDYGEQMGLGSKDYNLIEV